MNSVQSIRHSQVVLHKSPRAARPNPSAPAFGMSAVMTDSRSKAVYDRIDFIFSVLYHTMLEPVPPDKGLNGLFYRAAQTLSPSSAEQMKEEYDAKQDRYMKFQRAVTEDSIADLILEARKLIQTNRQNIDVEQVAKMMSAHANQAIDLYGQPFVIKRGTAIQQELLLANNA